MTTSKLVCECGHSQKDHYGDEVSIIIRGLCRVCSCAGFTESKPK